MKTFTSILFIATVMVLYFLGTLIMTAPASADELPPNGPSFSVQVFYCDANGENCLAADPVVKVSNPAPNRGNSAEQVIAQVIERVEIERAIQNLIADANAAPTDTRPLDTPKPTALAGR